VAEVRVSKQFKDDFDTWANHVVQWKEWTQEEIDGLKQLMRDYELADGPDRLRDTLVHFTPDGKEHPSAIDDPKMRYGMWANWFADEANTIRNRVRKAA